MSKLLSSCAHEEMMSCSEKTLNSTIQYLQYGSQGKPVLFLHGMPCSAFLWRRVMPQLAENNYCIAPNLMGMGGSGESGVAYTILDHVNYIEAFIDQLKLKDILLVVHGWGSLVGLDIAARRPELFRGLVMCESHLRPVESRSDLALPVQELLNQLGEGEARRKRVVEQNFLIDTWLPSYTMKKLNSEEMNFYRSQFVDLANREVLLQYINDLPVGDGKDDATQLISNYSTWLESSALPKLLLYGIPGFITTMKTVTWAKESLPNLTLAEVPDALHFIPETSPNVFSLAVNEWLDEQKI